MTAKQRLLADLSYSEKANILMAVALFINSNAATSDVKDFMKMLAAAMVFPENDALGFLEKDHVENQLYIDLPRRVRNVVLVVGLMAALYCGSCSEQCKNNIAIFAHHLGVNPSMPKRIFLELSM